ncbi:hypothetical protein ETAA8_65850 [Anatilimnocola aggregata]|uniref:Uncharacterized protein n=1 Tax=Anatilimnocola aggregata TaxID=2528021 RepID=A0A517YMH1_9BACT|nr:hypothetical protein [Anatilimnocola aggregata]QDU31427.1 hypothetical protein ETAA8_65850 [Anatilimnocola aggregata]
MTSRAPLIVAIVLLLLPVLYVGSYLALVEPQGIVIRPEINQNAEYYLGYSPIIPAVIHRYRFQNDIAETFYWPLEQIDRKVRPGAWLIHDSSNVE